MQLFTSRSEEGDVDGLDWIDAETIRCRVVEDPDLITRAAEHFGSQSIVVSLDAKRNFFGMYSVYTHGGTRNTGIDPIEYARRAERLGAGELILNSIDRDGTQQGYDTDLIKSVSEAVRIPVVACGGAGKIDHLAEAVYQEENRRLPREVCLSSTASIAPS